MATEDPFNITFGHGRGSDAEDSLACENPGVGARLELARLLDAGRAGDFTGSVLALHEHGGLLDDRPLLGELMAETVNAAAGFFAGQWAPVMRVLLDSVGLRGWQADVLLASGRDCHIAPAAAHRPLVVPGCQTLCGQWTAGRRASAWGRPPRGAFADPALGYRPCPACAQHADAFGDATELADYPMLAAPGMATLAAFSRSEAGAWVDTAVRFGHGRELSAPTADAIASGLSGAVRDACLRAAACGGDREHALWRALSDSGYEFLVRELSGGPRVGLTGLLSTDRWESLLQALCPETPGELDEPALRGCAQETLTRAVRLLWAGESSQEGPFGLDRRFDELLP